MSETETAVENTENKDEGVVERQEERAKDGETSASGSTPEIRTRSTDAPAVNDNQNGEEELREPPRKKSKKSKQSKAAAKVPEAIPNDKYPYARLRGIRIFSDREIEVQDAEMTREYWRFWNQTAEELCSDRAYNEWGKRDLKLYIDAAWIIHKTYLQEVTERQLAENMKELQENHGYTELPQKIKNQDQTVTTSLSKLQDSTANLNQLNVELTKVRGKHMNLKQRPVDDSYNQKKKDEEVRQSNKQVGEYEKNLYEGMSEVKRHQDSLKKALNRLKNMIYKARNDRPLQDATTSM